MGLHVPPDLPAVVAIRLPEQLGHGAVRLIASVIDRSSPMASASPRIVLPDPEMQHSVDTWQTAGAATLAQPANMQQWIGHRPIGPLYATATPAKVHARLLAARSATSEPRWAWPLDSRQEVVIGLAERLALAPARLRAATAGLRLSVLRSALQVLSGPLAPTALDASERRVLRSAVHRALARLSGLEHLLRVVTEIASLESSPVLFFRVLREEAALRHCFSKALQRIELYPLLSLHLGARNRGTNPGSAELMFIVQAACAGAVIEPVLPSGRDGKRRCDFCLPDPSGDTLVEVKHCWGKQWSDDERTLLQDRLGYAVGQLDQTMRDWPRPVAHRYIAVYFEPHLETPLRAERFNTLRAIVRNTVPQDIRLLVGFLPATPTVQPGSIFPLDHD